MTDFELTYSLPCPLTELEKPILNRIIEPDFEEVEDFSLQVPFATVVRNGQCG